MAGVSYIENGSIKPITGIRVGVNNTARFVKKGWVGVNGVARLCYYQELVAIPTLSGTYTYNGSEQTVTISSLDTDKVNVSGTLKATNAGTYQITFSLKSRMTAWADHTQGDKTLEWSINRQIVTIPTIITNSYTYDGSNHSIVLDGFNSNTMAMQGNDTAKDAGDYLVYVSLKDSQNYIWSDGQSATKQYSWSIAQQILIPPVVTSATTYTYDGQAKSLTFSGYDDSTMYKDGDITVVNAGEKTTWIYLKDSANYKWSTVSTPYVGYDWKINKAVGHVYIDGKIEITDYWIELNVEYTFTITGNENSLLCYSVSVWGDANNSLRTSIYEVSGVKKLKVQLINGNFKGAWIMVKLSRSNNYSDASAALYVRYQGSEG